MLPSGQRLHSLVQIQIPATPGSEEWDQVASTCCLWPVSHENFDRPAHNASNSLDCILDYARGRTIPLFKRKLKVARFSLTGT
jgi:hypothetical protein